MKSLSSIVRQILLEAPNYNRLTPRSLALAVHARQLLQDLEDRQDRAIPTSLDSYTTVVGRRFSGVALADYYAVLGLSRGATAPQIVSASRQRMMALRPEINPTASAASLRREVEEATRVLTDPSLRAAYDAGQPLPTARGEAVALPPSVVGTEPNENDLRLLRQRFPTIQSIVRLVSSAREIEDASLSTDEEMNALDVYREKIESGAPEQMAAAEARRELRMMGSGDAESALENIRKMSVLRSWPLNAMLIDSPQYQEEFFPTVLSAVISNPQGASIMFPGQRRDRASEEAEAAGGGRGVNAAADAVLSAVNSVKDQGLPLSEDVLEQVDDYIVVISDHLKSLKRSIPSLGSMARTSRRAQMGISEGALKQMLEMDDDDDIYGDFDPEEVTRTLGSATAAPDAPLEQPEPEDAQRALTSEELDLVDELEDSALNAVDRLESEVVALAGPVMPGEIEEIRDAVALVFSVVRSSQ